VKKILLFVGLATALLMPACSRLDLAYTWADTYIASKVDDYFDLSWKQSRALKKSLHADLEKLKQSVLPAWIHTARDLEKSVAENSLSDKKIAPLFSSIMAEVERFTGYFSTTAADFISSINAQQLAHFEKEVRSKNSADLKKIKDTEKYRREMREKYHKYFEMFIGRLTPAQETLLEKHLSENPFPAELRIKNKEFLLQQFSRHASSFADLQTFVRDYYSHPEKYKDPVYESAFQSYKESLGRLVTGVLTSLTTEQRNTLRTNLREKIEELEKIQRKG